MATRAVPRGGRTALSIPSPQPPFPPPPSLACRLSPLGLGRHSGPAGSRRCSSAALVRLGNGVPVRGCSVVELPVGDDWQQWLGRPWPKVPATQMCKSGSAFGWFDDEGGANDVARVILYAALSGTSWTLRLNIRCNGPSGPKLVRLILFITARSHGCSYIAEEHGCS
jgi:hypothetical protein